MLNNFLDWAKRQARRAGDSVVRGWDNLHPGIKGVLSLLPVVGDGAELAAQAYKIAVQKKQGDPVIITLSALGLMADAGNLTGVGAGFNIALAGFKGAYQLMKPAAKKSLRELMEICSKNPAQMGRFLEFLTLLAKNPKLFNEFLTNPILRDNLPEILRTAVFVGLKPAAHLAQSIYKSVTGKDLDLSSAENSGTGDIALVDTQNRDPKQQEVLDRANAYGAENNLSHTQIQSLIYATAIKADMSEHVAKELSGLDATAVPIISQGRSEPQLANTGAAV
jgi:hypothetical protein